MTASSGRARMLPMETAGTEHFIDRTYREGGTFECVRATHVNAIAEPEPLAGLFGAPAEKAQQQRALATALHGPAP